MRQLFDWLGGRKVLVFLLVFVFVTVATFTKISISAEAVELLKWVGGLYMVGNGVVAVANNIGTRRQP
jgi:threonine/homoserine/homoserine lactone efflux protein